jgi:hypothetical protein
MRYIKRIPQDMTYRQHELQNIFKEYYSKKMIPTSTDLKTATDRIPVSVTSFILSKI